MLQLPVDLRQANVPAFLRELPAYVARESAVVIDASALSHFDSSAIAVLLECRRVALASGKTFATKGLPARLLQLAGLYGVDQLLVPPKKS